MAGTVVARATVRGAIGRHGPLAAQSRFSGTAEQVPPKAKPTVLLATTETIPGKCIKEYRGLAMGSSVRTKDVSKDVFSAVKAIFGGELKHYTELMSDTREEALERLQEHASSMGANAVVGVRMTTSNIAQAASEVMAFGTAVIVE